MWRVWWRPTGCAFLRSNFTGLRTSHPLLTTCLVSHSRLYSRTQHRWDSTQNQIFYTLTLYVFLDSAPYLFSAILCAADHHRRKWSRTWTQTRGAIVAASRLPMSIIIVGVGKPNSQIWRFWTEMTGAWGLSRETRPYATLCSLCPSESSRTWVKNQSDEFSTQLIGLAHALAFSFWFWGLSLAALSAF